MEEGSSAEEEASSVVEVHFCYFSSLVFKG